MWYFTYHNIYDNYRIQWFENTKYNKDVAFIFARATLLVWQINDVFINLTRDFICQISYDLTYVWNIKIKWRTHRKRSPGGTLLVTFGENDPNGVELRKNANDSCDVLYN
jgi:hypothetical protein